MFGSALKGLSLQDKYLEICLSFCFLIKNRFGWKLNSTGKTCLIRNVFVGIQITTEKTSQNNFSPDQNLSKDMFWEYFKRTNQKDENVFLLTSKE